MLTAAKSFSFEKSWAQQWKHIGDVGKERHSVLLISEITRWLAAAAE